MGTSTLSSSTATGITLSASGAYLSPFTVTSGGKIATGDIYGIYSTLSGASLQNNGNISSTNAGGSGVGFKDIGSITNTGAIYGPGAGVALYSSGVVSNATANAGINGGFAGVIGVTAPITVDNAGTISGGAFGIYLRYGGTVQNNGTIAVTAGNYAIAFGGTAGGNRLIVDSNAVFTGIVRNQTAYETTIELAAGAGTLAGVGVSFAGFTNLEFDTGAQWDVTGTALGLGDITITGFTHGDTLDITDFSATSASYIAGTGLVMLDANGKAEVINFTGDFTNNPLLIHSDGNGGTDITEPLFSLSNTYLNTGIVLSNNGSTPYGTPFTVFYQAGIRVGNETAIYSNVTSAYLYNQGSIVSQFGNNAGVEFNHGGTIVQGAANPLISGYYRGVEINNGAGTVENFGTIAGGGKGGIGVDLTGGGAVSNNSAHARITGAYYGIAVSGAAGSIENFGTIIGKADAGIVLHNAGSVLNDGFISSGGRGIYIKGNGTVQNYGTLLASNGDALTIRGGANVLNGASAAITGGVNGDGIFISTSANNTVGIVTNYGTITGVHRGVYIGGPATLTNGGTITGGDDAVFFQGNGTTNRLIIDPGAVFNGAVVASTLSSNTIELASGTGGATGTLAGIGSQFTGFTTLAFDNGSAWNLAGIEAGFNGDTISGFSTHDTLDITDLTISSTLPSTLSADASHVLSIAGSNGDTLNLTFTSLPAGADFILRADGHGGTKLTEDIPCFRAGTHILTTNGERLVQDIAVGDHLITQHEHGPQSRQVVWTGQKRVDISRHARPHKIAPVRIRAGAFACNIPKRDLYLSPDHALYIGGVLIQAAALLNGVTVIQDLTARYVSYHHIELAQHEILLAEGLPVESFLDTGIRSQFNTDSVTALQPDFHPKSSDDFCAPLILQGPEITAARQDLLARAREIIAATAMQAA
jgi:hypothetical protein